MRNNVFLVIEHQHLQESGTYFRYYMKQKKHCAHKEKREWKNLAQHTSLSLRSYQIVETAGRENVVNLLDTFAHYFRLGDHFFTTSLDANYAISYALNIYDCCIPLWLHEKA